MQSCYIIVTCLSYFYNISACSCSESCRVKSRTTIVIYFQFKIVHAAANSHLGLVAAILESCSEFLWEKQPRGSGLQVYNAYTEEEMTVYVTIRRLMEDSVGLSKCVGCRGNHSYVGTQHSSPSEHCVRS